MAAEPLAPWLGGVRVPADLASPVVVACSGGPDSLALLALSAALGLQPVAVHVDHGLRPGSDAEAEVVRRAAALLGADVEAVSVDVGHGPGLEARARALRYEALEVVRSRRGASAVLVGHTADDQAETVLLNLLRGSGSAGLGGMPWRRDHLVRPLLGLRRADTVEICARLGLAPLDDAMNHDLDFRRVWIRREVLPMLEAGAHRDLGPVLARQAGLVRDESDYLDGVADRELDGWAGAVPAASLLELATPVARRVVRRWLGSPPPSSEVVEAVLDVAGGGRRAAELPGGRRVERSGGRLHVVEPAAIAGEPVELAVPGAATGLGVTLGAWVERAGPVRWPDGRWCCVLDADRVGARLVLRPPRPGERFRPLGLGGSKLVSEALAEVGVPPSRRAVHPVLATPAGDAVWLLGYRVGAPAGVTPGTRRFLWVRAGTGGSEEGDDA